MTSTDGAAAPARLFTRLVDDAGLFPPTGLSMPDAIARYRSDRCASSEVLTGRFVCPAARLDELVSVLRPEDRVEVAVICSPLDDGAMSAAAARVERDGRLSLGAIEGLFDPSLPRRSDGGVEVFAEVPLFGEWECAFEHLAESGLGLKVRCGGLDASFFPPVELLAAVIVSCARSSVSFKATAGLHHAVRHRDAATGFVHHGFANLVLAACRAVEGWDDDGVRAALTIDDATSLVTELCAVDEKTADRARELFRSYGSCSTSEPVEDLGRLGLIGFARG